MKEEKIKPENERIKKTVKKFGDRGAHTTLPYDWIGEKVLIIRLNGGENKMTLEELMKYFEENKELPQDLDAKKALKEFEDRELNPEIYHMGFLEDFETALKEAKEIQDN